MIPLGYERQRRKRYPAVQGVRRRWKEHPHLATSSPQEVGRPQGIPWREAVIGCAHYLSIGRRLVVVVRPEQR